MKDGKKTPVKRVTDDDDFSSVVVHVSSGKNTRSKGVSQKVDCRKSPRTKKDVEPDEQCMEKPPTPTKLTFYDITNWKGCYRSNLVTIVNRMATVSLRPAHIMYLKKTPFWKLFEAMLQSKIDQRKCRKFEESVLMVIRSYEKNSSAFRLGSKLVTFTRNDVQFIFGIECGVKEIDISCGSAASMEFVKRRDISPAQRLTSRNINFFIDKLLPSDKDEDVRDVVRLLCMHLFLSLFFSTSGTAVGWGYLKLMEDLEGMKEYDWAELITVAVMGSIHNHHKNPQKITGCVIALLYWVCEHTTLVKPDSMDAIPRLVKWDLQTLQRRMKEKPLSSLTNTEVMASNLVPTEAERRICGFGGDVMNLCTPSPERSRAIVHRTVEQRKKRRQEDSITELPTFDLGVCTTEQKSVTPKKRSGCNVGKTEIELLRMDNSELKCKVQLLEGEKKEMHEKLLKLEAHISDLVSKRLEEQRKHDETVSLKDAEIVALSGKLEEIRAEHSDLIDQIKKQDDLMLEQMVKDDSKLQGTPGKRGTKLNKDPNSMVRYVKAKPRKRNLLPEYVYNEIRAKEKVPEKSRDVDVIQMLRDAVQNKTESDVVSRYPVFEFLTQPDRKKVLQIVECAKNNIRIWTGSKDYNCVYLEDIVELINDAYVSSWVLDAYGEILMIKQGKRKRKSNEENNTSYICTSLFMELVKGKNVAQRNQVIRDLLESASNFRYIHFPIYHNKHYTLCVYDQTDGVWFFYNSLIPTKGRDYNAERAAKLKKWVEEYWKEELKLSTQETKIELQKVADSPQQDINSVDCGLVVCYVMKQYCNFEQDRMEKGTLPRERTRAIRAGLIHVFLE